MSKFNPSDPLRIGLEWPGHFSKQEPIDYAREIACGFTPTATASLSRVDFYTSGVVFDDFNQWTLATLYQRGREQAFGEVRSTVGTVFNAATTGTVVPGGLPSAALLFTTDQTWITLNNGQYVDINFSVPSFQTPRPRILNVAFQLQITSPAATGAAVTFNYRTLTPATMPIGVASIPSSATGVPDDVYTLNTGEIFLAGYDYITNPSLSGRRPWFTTDLTNLQLGTIDLRILNTGAPSWNLQWASMTVTYCEENRQAVGGVVLTSDSSIPWASNSWSSISDLWDLDLGSPGTQVLAGREYLLSLTRATDMSLSRVTSQQALWRQFGEPRNLSAIAPANPAIAECFTMQRLVDGRIARPPVSMDRACAIVAGTAGGLNLAASQPYQRLNVQTGSTVTQDVVSSVTATYRTLGFTVRKVGSPGDLVATIFGAGGSTATLTPADFATYETDASGYADVTVTFATPVTMTAGVERTIIFATGNSSDRWEMPSFDTGTSNAFYNNANYGGTAQVGNSFNNLDYAVTMATTVPAVTGASISRGFFQLTPVLAGCVDKQPHSMDYANICWGKVPVVSGSPFVTGAPLVTGFCAWQVDRRDTLTDWRRIASISDYNINCFEDFEGRVGVSTDYRVRLMRLDGACGDWTTVTGFVRVGASQATQAPAVTGGACPALLFTANESPASTVAYPLAWISAGAGVPTEDFTFAETETVVTQRIHGRDYQVAFRPLERDGVRFSRTLLVNALSVPTARLDSGFTSLRDLAWETLSYVCVLDPRGGRWFATVLVPGGTVREANQVYLANVDIIETTDRPSVVDVRSST